MSILGTRPRPRVALIGEFDKETSEKLGKLFPTIWIGKDFDEIEGQVSPAELDLVIIGQNSDGYFSSPNWLSHVHIICFSPDIDEIPGELSNIKVTSTRETNTEEYILPNIPLNFDRLREIDLGNLSNTKGWDILHESASIREPYNLDQYKVLRKKIIDGALVLDSHTGLALATIFKRENTNLGIAWLPNNLFRIAPWTEAICLEWAKTDKTRFPNFGDWTKQPKWVVAGEQDIIGQINNLIDQKAQMNSEINEKISILNMQLLEISSNANKGLRRLITAQDNELVDEVESAFKALGFAVKKMDQFIPDGSPKLEDLRISDPSIKDWEAIVEIRGYTKSGGKTDDISRLERFSRFYEKEMGRRPDKKIYVINGQIELLPDQRQRPLASSPDDIREFAEQDGIIIWSLDLYQVIKNLGNIDIVATRKSITSTKGTWVWS